jgi:hypothetical protein
MFFDYEKKKKSLKEYSWVRDGRLYVEHTEWAEIKSNYERKEIVAYLRKLIVEIQPSTPFHEYTKAEINTEFRKLCATKYIPREEEWNTDRVEDIPLLFKGQYVFFKNQNPTGKKVSNTHTQRVRSVAWYTARPTSYAKAWDRLRKGEPDCLAINIVYFADKCLDNKALMSGARLSGTLVNQFKPSVAKGVYDFFGAKKVLDFSAGWGDRLVGFLASNAESYIGIDPNTKLHEPYRKIVEDNNRDKETKFICSPAERVDYSNLDYDFVFTSPPYFNLEVYTNEDTQSAKKETKIDDWLNDFLFETVNRVYEGLVDGGRIAINICDHRLFKVCKTLIEHMDSLGATYEGVLGFEIASRPLNSKGNVSRGNQDQRGEPIFIWSKGEAPSPKYNQDNFFGV